MKKLLLVLSFAGCLMMSTAIPVSAESMDNYANNNNYGTNYGTNMNTNNSTNTGANNYRANAANDDGFDWGWLGLLGLLGLAGARNRSRDQA